MERLPASRSIPVGRKTPFADVDTDPLQEPGEYLRVHRTLHTTATATMHTTHNTQHTCHIYSILHTFPSGTEFEVRAVAALRAFQPSGPPPPPEPGVLRKCIGLGYIY